MEETSKKKQEQTESFSYMEELSKAYKEAFAKRLAGRAPCLNEEKRELLIKMQLEISRAAGKLALALSSEEKKELARMIKESAEETLRALAYDEEETFFADPINPLPPSLLLSRAVLLANRSLNLLVRHTRFDETPIFLVLSELSALYALAAIN